MRNRTVKLAALAVITLSGFVLPLLTSEPVAEAGPQRRAQPRRAQSKPDRAPTYSEFSHATAEHRKACDTCHKFPSANWKQARKGDEAFPDVTEYPEHSSCLGCHRQQFFKGAQPIICSVCHQQVTPKGGERHPFPTLGEAFERSKKGETAASDFGLFFPHDKHIEIVGKNAQESCAECHQTYQPQNDSDEEFVTRPPKDLPEDRFWLKKGTFKTSPASHAACFTCHSEDSGLKPAPVDCATCHRLLPADQVIRLTEARNDFDPRHASEMGIKDKTTLEKWSKRDTARYRHEWIPHAGLSCNACHNVAEMNTVEEKTKKVSVQSCGGEGTGCHIEATAEGILNFEVEKKKASPAFRCVKCHVNNGAKAMPETHTSAVSKAGKK
jgi:hypothetical protein